MPVISIMRIFVSFIRMVLSVTRIGLGVTVSFNIFLNVCVLIMSVLNMLLLVTLKRLILILRFGSLALIMMINIIVFN